VAQPEDREPTHTLVKQHLQWYGRFALIRRNRDTLHFSYNFIIVEDMRKREYLGQLELMVLLAVIRPAKDAYGVLISREIAAKSGREIALASVYAALERLEKKRLVVATLGEPTAERGGRARTFFRPTAAGLREAREAHDTLLRLSSGLWELEGETI
jgi:PadR family transcriptional regulator, regulatory protein PadR